MIMFIIGIIYFIYFTILYSFSFSMFFVQPRINMEWKLVFIELIKCDRKVCSTYLWGLMLPQILLNIS